MSGTGIATQERNSDLVALLTPDFQTRNEPNFAWKSACASYLALPGLRGFWPMSAVAYTNPQGLDLSGNGSHLTNNNTSTFGHTYLIPHVSFVSGSSQSLSKTDGGAANWADITGTETYIDAADRGLTFYAWVYFDNAASANEHIMAKWGGGGAGTWSYRLLRIATGELYGVVSTDGTTFVAKTTTDTLAATTWYFVALQYDPSTELSVWINGEKDTLAVGVPASIFDSTSAFYLGCSSVPNAYMDGKQSMVALCASFHSNSIIKAVYNQTRAMFGSL